MPRLDHSGLDITGLSIWLSDRQGNPMIGLGFHKNRDLLALCVKDAVIHEVENSPSNTSKQNIFKCSIYLFYMYFQFIQFSQYKSLPPRRIRRQDSGTLCASGILANSNLWFHWFWSKSSRESISIWNPSECQSWSQLKLFFTWLGLKKGRSQRWSYTSPLRPISSLPGCRRKTSIRNAWKFNLFFSSTDSLQLWLPNVIVLVLIGVDRTSTPPNSWIYIHVNHID